MENIRLMLAALKNDSRAVTALEYAMIAGLIAVVIVGAVTSLGTHMNSILSSINSTL